MDEEFRIIDQITTAGAIDTPEGRVGRLIRGEACTVQYLEMPPRLYIPEHPHPWESVVYTVRGRWVLCVSGKRSRLAPGSLLWLKPGVSRGFEVPYGEPALILVFKPARDETDDEGFRAYREDVGRKPVKIREGGTKFDLGLLPPDHPARVFE